MIKFENRLAALLHEREEAWEVFNTLKLKYRQTIPTPSVITKLSQVIMRLKSLNHRIAQYGNKYDIVFVSGIHLIQTSKVSYYQDFKVYFTDVSIQDAKLLVMNKFPTAASLKYQLIHPGSYL